MLKFLFQIKNEAKLSTIIISIKKMNLWWQAVQYAKKNEKYRQINY